MCEGKSRVSEKEMIEVTPAQVIHADAAAHQLHAIELLKLCHAYLRGVEINEPNRCKLIDRDTLARLINIYLNKYDF